MNADAARWNGRYQQNSPAWLRNKPAPLLQNHLHLLPAGGLALDAAAGVGSNGRFLLNRNFRVIAVDISESGLRLGQSATQSPRYQSVIADLSTFWLPANYFDLILNFRFLERALFPAYRRALKPGGLLFFETFLAQDEKAAVKPHLRPHHFLQPGELEAAFAGFETVFTAVVKKNNRASQQLIARKRR